VAVDTEPDLTSPLRPAFASPSIECERDWINVTELGACDGQDSTAAFLRAFRIAEERGGGTIYVPTGTYLYPFDESRRGP